MKKLKKIIGTLILSWAARACQLTVFGDTFLKIGQHETHKAIWPYEPEINHCKQIFMFICHTSITKHGGLICGWSTEYYLYIAYMFLRVPYNEKASNLIIFKNTILQSLHFM